ncbi:MAG: hypothetical protein R3F19_05960 [Verrucomicrobiales bacterium]
MRINLSEEQFANLADGRSAKTVEVIRRIQTEQMLGEIQPPRNKAGANGRPFWSVAGFTQSVRGWLPGNRQVHEGAIASSPQAAASGD